MENVLGDEGEVLFHVCTCFAFLQSQKHSYFYWFTMHSSTTVLTLNTSLLNEILRMNKEKDQNQRSLVEMCW